MVLAWEIEGIAAVVALVLRRGRLGLQIEAIFNSRVLNGDPEVSFAVG